MSEIITPFDAGKMIGRFEQLVDDFPDVFPKKTLSITFSKDFIAAFISENCTEVKFNFAISYDERLTLVLEKQNSLAGFVQGAAPHAASPNAAGGGGGGGGIYGNGGDPLP